MSRISKMSVLTQFSLTFIFGVIFVVLKQCFNRFGGPDWPLCSVQLEAPMNAAKDSVTCLRRTAYSKNSYSLSQTQFCDPLGGTNIFNILFDTSKNETISNKSVIVLSARLDSFSMFDNLSPGADSALTSVVTLLSVANTLNKLKSDIQKKTNKTNVLFALFDGEAFDYIGSSRVLYDMDSQKFPNPNSEWAQIRTHHFSHFIELSQLGRHHNLRGGKHQLYIHKNNDSKAINELQKIFNESALKSSIEIKKIPDVSATLPPSSLQTFLKRNSLMAGVVLTNHENQFTNKFYNSFYDDFFQLNKSDYKLSKTLTDISTIISKTIYKLITNQSMASIESNETLVERLLECYLVSPVCQLFKYVSPDTTFHSQTMEPLPTYVGVYHSLSLSSTSRYFTHRLLSYLTGDVLNITKDECTQLDKSQRYSFIWTEGLNCVKSQTFKTEALSPAFDEYLTDGHISGLNSYSLWTESQWKSVSARIFVMPGPLQQWLTLITGLIILILSFFIVYIMDKKSSLLFNDGNDNIPQQTLSVASVGC